MIREGLGLILGIVAGYCLRWMQDAREKYIHEKKREAKTWKEI